MAVVMPYNFVVYGVWVRYNQINKSVFIKEGKTMDKEWKILKFYWIKKDGQLN